MATWPPGMTVCVEIGAKTGARLDTPTRNCGSSVNNCRPGLLIRSSTRSDWEFAPSPPALIASRRFRYGTPLDEVPEALLSVTPAGRPGSTKATSRPIAEPRFLIPTSATNDASSESNRTFSTSAFTVPVDVNDARFKAGPETRTVPPVENSLPAIRSKSIAFSSGRTDTVDWLLGSPLSS